MSAVATRKVNRWIWGATLVGLVGAFVGLHVWVESAYHVFGLSASAIWLGPIFGRIAERVGGDKEARLTRVTVLVCLSMFLFQMFVFAWLGPQLLGK